MATIRTALSLYDGMTGPLRKINAAMRVLIDQFDSTQRASRRMVDTSAMQEARRMLDEAEAGFDNLHESIEQAGRQQRKLNGSFRDGGGAVGGFADGIRKAAAALGGLYAAKQVLNLSDQVSNTTARLGLIVDPGSSVEQLEEQIHASAQRARADYLATADAVARLQMNAGNAFQSNGEAVAFMEQINKQFAISGAGAEEQKYAMIQLTQAMAAGTLRGEELNSVLDQAPTIARTIEQYMGIAQGSIKQYAEQGLISAEVVKNAMLSAADETNAKFESMPMTFAQVWTSIKNGAVRAFQPVLARISEIINSQKFQTFVNNLVIGFQWIAGVASVVLEIMVEIVNWIADNWGIIEPILWGVAGAMASYLVVTKGAAIATGIATAAKMAALPVYALLTGATIADTAAQWGLNSALYACPLVWIIGLILVLIGVFYAVIAAVNEFAGTSISATGAIAGAFMVAFAFIGNVLIALWNLVVDVFVAIYNVIADVANFVGNVFNDPINAIIHLFFDLADTVLNILQMLASAIDTIFGSNLAGAVQGWRDDLSAWVDDTFGKQEEFVKRIDASEWKLDRFSYEDAWNTGYNAGKGLEDKLSSMFQGLGDINSDLGIDPTPDLPDFDAIAGNTGQTASNTGAMADGIEIEDEALEYLRDIAERDAINRFTTAQITIHQSNENHIASDMDLDGVMRYMIDTTVREMDRSYEGVHI